MSEKNHPNFHAVNFTAHIYSGLINSLRGESLKYRIQIGGSEKIINMLSDFTFAMEEQIEKEIKDV